MQVVEIGLGNSSTDTSLLKLSFDYGTALENNGSMKSQTMVVPSVGANQGFTATQNYAYDSLNRIQSAQETVSGNQTWKQTFQYDRYGNRRFDANNTTTLGSCSQSQCNPLINTSDNRLSNGQGYTYDRDGNITVDAENQRFVYDAESKQTQFFKGTNNTSTPDATYLYDGEGKRVKKISYQETTVFVYDRAGQLVAEYSTQISQTPQTSYLTSDHLGSPRVTTNQLGAVTSRKDFSAFGEETLTTQRTSGLGYDPLSQKNQPEDTRQDYTGYQKDEESGLEYAQARYYNSSHGRFTSVDPLTASANIRDPQTFNRYSYVLNSPYKFTDPLGLLPIGSGACGQWCSNSGPSVDGSAFRGRDTSFDWAQQIEASPTNEGVAERHESGHASTSDSQQQAQEPKPPAATDDKNLEKNSFFINMMILNMFGINSETQAGNIVTKPVSGLIDAAMNAAREIFKDAEVLNEYIVKTAQVMDAAKDFNGDAINQDPSKNKMGSINDTIKQKSRAIDIKITEMVKYISARFGGSENTFTVRLKGTSKIESGHYYGQIGLANSIRTVLNASRRRAILKSLAP